jgi:hypothetical protein
MLVLWEPLTVVFLYHTRSFLQAYISQHSSYKDSMTSLMNQILHLTNPHDKLSTFVLYPRLGFLSIHRLTHWDPRLGHLSLFCVGRRIRDGEQEPWWSQSFTWSDWDTDDSLYVWSWCSIRHIVTSSLLCELSHTLSPYACLKCELLLCSLDLIACMIIVLSYILLFIRLDLFAACGVHRSHYSYFLCDLICSPLCVTLFWLWSMLFHHVVYLQYICDF